ncbi:MAG: hypothetical protein MRQ09_04610, partial [Candidatus Midichloria sp.]|nr:hypothetical protein [Candidatus Midichloria sp.]
SRTDQFFLSGRFLDEQFSETDTDTVTVVGPRADHVENQSRNSICQASSTEETHGCMESNAL